MDFPWFELPDLPVSPQSPANGWPGLDDLHSDGVGLFGSNTVNIVAGDEVDQGGNIPQQNQERESSSPFTRGYYFQIHFIMSAFQ